MAQSWDTQRETFWAAAQPEQAILTLRLLYSAAPIVLTVLTWMLAAKYTLTLKNHGLIRKAIDVRRTTGCPTDDPEVISACEQVSGMAFDSLWVGRSGM